MWLATKNPIILWISLERHSLHIHHKLLCTHLPLQMYFYLYPLLSCIVLLVGCEMQFCALLWLFWIFLSCGTFGVVISSNFWNSILGYCWIWKRYRKTWGWGLRIFATGPHTHVSQQESKDILLEQDGVRNIHPCQFREIAQLWWEGTP
jgi:hypothetical protein